MAARRLEGIVVQVHRAADIIEKLGRFVGRGQPGVPPAPVPPDEMATCLAHELDPPLAIIGLFAGNALRDLRHGDAEAAVRRLEGIVVQVRRAAGVIEKLRRFARAGQPGAPRHIRIAAEVRPTDGMLRLTVADSGGGIVARNEAAGAGAAGSAVGGAIPGRAGTHYSPPG